MFQARKNQVEHKRLQMSDGMRGGAFRVSVNTGEFKTPTQLSLFRFIKVYWGGGLFFVYFWKLWSFLHKMHKSWQVCRKMQSMSSLKEMCATEIKIAILNIFICYCLVNSPCSVFAFEKLQSAFWFELGKYFCSVQNFQFPLKLLKLVLFIRELTKICK